MILYDTPNLVVVYKSVFEHTNYDSLPPLKLKPSTIPLDPAGPTTAAKSIVAAQSLDSVKSLRSEIPLWVQTCPLYWPNSCRAILGSF